MKKRQVNLKKLTLGKSVITRMESVQIKAGDAFSRYSCGEAGCIPPIDITLDPGCQFDTVGCASQKYTCDCDTVREASCVLFCD